MEPTSIWTHILQSTGQIHWTGPLSTGQVHYQLDRPTINWTGPLSTGQVHYQLDRSTINWTGPLSTGQVHYQLDRSTINWTSPQSTGHTHSLDNWTDPQSMDRPTISQTHPLFRQLDTSIGPTHQHTHLSLHHNIPNTGRILSCINIPLSLSKQSAHTTSSLGEQGRGSVCTHIHMCVCNRCSV